MKFINIGFGNMVSAGRIVAIASPDSEHVILSAIQTETITNRLSDDSAEDDGEDEE